MGHDALHREDVVALGQAFDRLADVGVDTGQTIDFKHTVGDFLEVLLYANVRTAVDGVVVAFPIHHTVVETRILEIAVGDVNHMLVVGVGHAVVEDGLMKLGNHFVELGSRGIALVSKGCGLIDSVLERGLCLIVGVVEGVHPRAGGLNESKQLSGVGIL